VMRAVLMMLLLSAQITHAQGTTGTTAVGQLVYDGAGTFVGTVSEIDHIGPQDANGDTHNFTVIQAEAYGHAFPLYWYNRRDSPFFHIDDRGRGTTDYYLTTNSDPNGDRTISTLQRTGLPHTGWVVFGVGMLVTTGEQVTVTHLSRARVCNGVIGTGHGIPYCGGFDPGGTYDDYQTVEYIGPVPWVRPYEDWTFVTPPPVPSLSGLSVLVLVLGLTGAMVMMSRRFGDSPRS
jgi:hypothetical protein